MIDTTKPLELSDGTPVTFVDAVGPDMTGRRWLSVTWKGVPLRFWDDGEPLFASAKTLYSAGFPWVILRNVATDYSETVKCIGRAVVRKILQDDNPGFQFDRVAKGMIDDSKVMQRIFATIAAALPEPAEKLTITIEGSDSEQADRWTKYFDQVNGLLLPEATIVNRVSADHQGVKR